MGQLDQVVRSGIISISAVGFLEEDDKCPTAVVKLFHILNLPDSVAFNNM